MNNPSEGGGMVVIPLTGLTLPHFGACPKTGFGFPTPYVVDFLCSIV